MRLRERGGLGIIGRPRCRAWAAGFVGMSRSLSVMPNPSGGGFCHGEGRDICVGWMLTTRTPSADIAGRYGENRG